MRYWSGTIGGIPLLDVGGDTAGFELTGASAFLGNWTGNTRPGLLGNPHTQYSELSGGRVIELKFLHIPKVLLTQLKALLVPIIPSGGAVACSFTDGYETITADFKPDVPGWIDRGEPDGDYIKDLTIRLKEIGA